GPALRYLSTFVFQGLATRLEDERITEEDRDGLPARVAELAPRDGDRWLSEREWLEQRADDFTAQRPRRIYLDLDIDDANLPTWETMDCASIIEYLSRETEALHRGLPGGDELLRDYGDPNNSRIYASAEDLERKWLAQYFSERSLSPPRAIFS